MNRDTRVQVAKWSLFNSLLTSHYMKWDSCYAGNQLLCYGFTGTGLHSGASFPVLCIYLQGYGDYIPLLPPRLADRDHSAHSGEECAHNTNLCAYKETEKIKCARQGFR